MTEQAPWSGPHAVAEQQPATDRDDHTSSTGVAAVDRVLGDLDRLDDLPLDEHLGAFERAHGALRDALDAQPDAQADVQPDMGRDERPDDPA